MPKKMVGSFLSKLSTQAISPSMTQSPSQNTWLGDLRPQTTKASSKDYSCQHCKTKLFTSADLQDHDSGSILKSVHHSSILQTRFAAGVPTHPDMNTRLNMSKAAATTANCTNQYFIKCMDWIQDTTGFQGQICCP